MIVLHEVWGPDSHIEKVCKRLRKLGFATRVPSLYSGYEDLLTSTNIQAAMEAVWDLSLDERRDKKAVARELARKGAGDDVEEVLAVLYDQNFRDGLARITMDEVRDAKAARGKVATLGFSLGGGLSLRAVMGADPPDDAVAYCGEPPKPRDVHRTSVPILAILAEHDELMNPKVPAFVGAALENGIDLTVKVFPNTMHGFFNETKKEAYDRNADDESWNLTTWFLERALRRL